MNKEQVIEELVKTTGYDKGKCIIINSILEDTFIIGRNNKEKMIGKFMSELDIDNEEAEKIYEQAMSVIASGVKDRLKHPFGSND